jgi:hypothetical protein
MRLSIEHRFHFGADRGLVGDELTGEQGWDALRLRSTGPFALPATRAELDARADADMAVRARAEALDAEIGDRSVVSYGVGAATTEVWLARLRPERLLTLTEFAPETAARLATLLPELRVERHDLRRDGALAADIHLFNRLDTELDDAELRDVFHRFGTERVIVVATELLTPKSVLRELRTRLRPGASRAGLVRSRGAFEALWRRTHDARRLRVGDLEGWLLEPRGPRGG